MAISPDKQSQSDHAEARKLILSGQVQGVGFRPFIYRIALQNNLTGWVRNCVGIVEIHVQGRPQDIERFTAAISTSCPPLAKPRLESEEMIDIEAFDEFIILESQDEGAAHITVPADLFLCDDCLAELNDPSDRRYRYPFINCTQCGPRYTLIRRLPYDRLNTTMAGFDMCPQCRSEYEDPADRRFHAEPIACPVCGPSLSYHEDGEIVEHEAALDSALTALRQAKVIAVKGIGGYHLMCDASSDEAVAKLRNNKPRPDKPLAVMFPAPAGAPFEFADKSLLLTDTDKAFLLQPARPILLVKKKITEETDDTLSELIAPGLGEVGMMLPYSPLHHLLLDEFGSALVATSANISGEPVLTDNDAVEKRLAHVADACLHHDRPIERPADDPVFRTVAGKARPMRTGRGSAPIELILPFELAKPVLAVGSHMKNVITLAWGKRAVISPHIGEMDSVRSLDVFQETITDLQALYGITAEAVICDAHPGYTTTRWAHEQGLPVHSVAHHRAHASSAYYECGTDSEQPILVFTWDGIGYGEDGTLWGGETLLGQPGAWQRVASMRPFYLPGGDKAGRQPWRSAAALCWELGLDYEVISESDAQADNVQALAMLRQAWQRKVNTPQASSVGRLFDAAAALLGVCTSASFEGQGPMQLEALCDAGMIKLDSFVDFGLTYGNNILIYDWKSLINTMLDSTLSVAERALLFHHSLAHNILQQAKVFRERYGVNTVSFSGGVFQNRVLTEKAMALLRDNDFEICLPELIPVNDAGISFGQVIEYGYRCDNEKI
jgi:hydrogenase maturation protein HypF